MQNQNAVHDNQQVDEKMQHLIDWIIGERNEDGEREGDAQDGEEMYNIC